ncbi:MAG: type II secretion system F family protein [Acidimicrobiales bacterium]
MSRALAIATLCLFAGLVLVLAELPWFRRPRLVDRISPYVAGASRRSRRSGRISASSFRDVAAPLARDVGDRLARLFGVGEALAARLDRVGSPLDSQAFRLRQLGWSVATFAGAGVACVALGPPAPLALLALLGAPLLAFLVLEQQLATASADRQQRTLYELPVVAEQLGMLVSAGYSLGAAIDRVGRRGSGVCAEDLRRVAARIRHGLSEAAALQEWASRADVEALDRLVAVLSLNREASDLGRLIGDEARSIRQEVHRRLLEAIERRSQQVWIPVTVATLVPGVLFLAVPFLEAMRLFTES